MEETNEYWSNLTGKALGRICTNVDFCANINISTTQQVVKLLIYDF